MPQKSKEPNPLTELPLGLAMSLAQNADAMHCFGSLPEERKQQIVSYIQTSATGPEAKHRIASAVEGLAHSNTDFLG